MSNTLYEEHYIKLTKKGFEEFKKAYSTSLSEGKLDFTFNGTQFLTAYAGYLIEYAKTQLK